jgi:uncharacterized protein YfaS (alpha-2-macroglobulin family)
MHPARLLLLLGVSAYLADPGDPLHVLRATPTGDASPGSAITVSFDRPVAGSLDRTVDPERIFEISPRIAGRLEWRDPITIRFVPASLLTPGTDYTVTIKPDFEAMDGSRLEQPYSFEFRVRGPEVLTSSVATRNSSYLTPDAKFALVVSAPVDAALMARLAYLEFNSVCPTRVVRLKVSGQREITDQDSWDYREAGGWDRSRSADPLRRVVELTPVQKLPHGCGGDLVVPPVLDEESDTGKPRRFSFATYGDFKINLTQCTYEQCPTGPIDLSFTTPVKGSEVLRRVRLQPAVPFTLSDTTDERANWTLQAELKPRTGYAVVVDTAVRDVFGQRLTGNPVGTMVTSGYAPTVDYEYGRLVVERVGFRTLPVRHINVDTLVALIAPVPDSLEAQFLARSAWGWDDLWEKVAAGAVTRRIAVKNERDHARIYGVQIPVSNARRPGSRTLVAVRISSPQVPPVQKGASRPLGPLALVQVTDLGVNARIGVQEGAVWVTGLSDGLPRTGATVTLRDIKGKLLATGATDSTGLVRLRNYQGVANAYEEGAENGGNLEAFVSVVYGTDRAVVGINQYDPDLSPWRFNVYGAWDDERIPIAGAVFTERGIYRPGEPVYAKAILRKGGLGSLRAPLRTDSLHWVFHDREQGVLLERTVAPSRYGTSDLTFRLPADIPLGYYNVAVQFKWRDKWHDLASTSYRVAEYRPPEFLVTMSSDTGPRFVGDQFKASLEARYLFGAPMARAALNWTARIAPISGWEISVPGAEGYYTGETGFWWEDESNPGGVTVLATGADTLDAAGRFGFDVPVTQTVKGKPSRVTIEAMVTDVNRQAVGSATSAIVHPADFYIAAKPLGQDYFWKAGSSEQIAILALTPDGRKVNNVRVRGSVIRREWHRVHRERDGMAEQIGEWVMDTVGTCNVTTAGDRPVSCTVTPPSGGIYVVALSAEDGKGRPVSTSFGRWASGSDWVPWNDENQFKMDVIADRERYSVGDTATVLFAAPFTDAEAWVTVEREGLIEQRRMRITSGSTMLTFPITEGFAPNAYVSIVVARGRSAPPGPLDDPGRPTIRVGYAQLRVTPEIKRLALEVEPMASEYRPGDTARVRLRVRDGKGAGQRSEVTLWAVDEGVLALTGYQTPDPLDLIYRERGLGMRLASNMVSVAPQVPEGEKGSRAPGGGGGADNTDILRSRFQTTAFFLGSVVTDSLGVAIARAKLPDNLTTFRVMAVAVTAGDRYGNGQSQMLVTRPLIARPALPRFLRAGDEFSAGVVVNQRAGGTPEVSVTANARGVELVGDSGRVTTLEAGRGREVRFQFRGRPTDSATFRFNVRGAGDADAVQTRLAVREAFRPRFHTIAGVLVDSTTAEFQLPDGIDPDRSELQLSLGGSPLSVIKGAFRSLRVYPYYCTEQISSSALPLIALYRAQQRAGSRDLAPPRAKEDIELAVATVLRRQREDGGIGYWSSSDWTTPWLSAYAGLMLLEARAAGIKVNDSALGRLADYLSDAIDNEEPVASLVMHWYENRRSLTLAERVAAADLLSRLGRPDVAAENELLRKAAQMDWEDRVRLAEVLARRRDKRPAQDLLLKVLGPVKVEGREAVIPDSLHRSFYFYSSLRPAAQLLRTVLAIDSTHPLIGPLVESLIQRSRAAHPWEWNTQDYGSAVYALAAFEQRQRRAAGRGITVRSGDMVLFRTDSSTVIKDSTVSLRGLLGPAANGGNRSLKVSLGAAGGGVPAYYYLTVKEIPLNRPVRPDDEGISVERWYESYGDGKPITEITAGDLVRVRLRITVPNTRHFVILDDALPAGLEAIDLSLRTAAPPGVGMVTPEQEQPDEESEQGPGYHWYYGSWDSGWWSPFDHRELRDDRVVYFATILWKGVYTATYVARATTPGVFIRPPAHAEEMYNPAVHGRSDGGVFTVKAGGR